MQNILTSSSKKETFYILRFLHLLLNCINCGDFNSSQQVVTWSIFITFVFSTGMFKGYISRLLHNHRSYTFLRKVLLFLCVYMIIFLLVLFVLFLPFT